MQQYPLGVLASGEAIVGLLIDMSGPVFTSRFFGREDILVAQKGILSEGDSVALHLLHKACELLKSFLL